MSIRRMRDDDVDDVIRITLAAFSDAVASSLSEKGVTTFEALVSRAELLGRSRQDNLMLVFEDESGIVGYIELKEGRHVAMLFVEPQRQRRGIGKALIAAALEHRRVDKVTVRASHNSVPSYEKSGFVVTGPPGELHGLKYVPMALICDG